MLLAATKGAIVSSAAEGGVRTRVINVLNPPAPPAPFNISKKYYASIVGDFFEVGFPRAGALLGAPAASE
jgi:hypothetical protein